jgi:hypothetical protein
LARQRAVSERKLVWSYLAVATGHSTLASTTDTFVLRLAECRHVDKPVFSKVHKEPVIHRWILPSYQKLRRRRLTNIYMTKKKIIKNISGRIS